MPIRENPQVKAELAELLEHPEVLKAEMALGERVAEIAKGLAPKRTGAGAASIHAEVARDSVDGVHVRVGFSRDHFYMLWAETGNEHQQPQPFLRPAAMVAESE